ncbi:hypothetical protein ONZ45_g7892 [Pleurotus djamor]|nr:hypothetical protein ONZ45_g7892 [Pleurotus djamor]
MLSSHSKSRSHRRSYSTSNVHAYDEEDLSDYLQPQSSSSHLSPAKKIVTSVKRSLSHSRPRKRASDDVPSSPPIVPSPYATSPSYYRYHDPSTVPSSSPPTLEQIAMGLHISRTPHLRPMTVGVRGHGGSAAGKPPSARGEVAQVYYSPYLSHGNGSALGTPSRSHSRSNSRTYPDPLRVPVAAPQPPLPRPPQRSASLPPPPARSSLKRAQNTASPPPNPGLSSGTRSVASTSTESSLSTTKSSVRGRSLMALSFKSRMGWLLGGKSSKAKESTSTLALDVAEATIIKKAVRFDDSLSRTASPEDQTGALAADADARQA